MNTCAQITHDYSIPSIAVILVTGCKCTNRDTHRKKCNLPECIVQIIEDDYYCFIIINYKHTLTNKL